MTQKSTFRPVVLTGAVLLLMLSMVSFSNQSVFAKNRHRQTTWRFVFAELFNRERVRPISRGEHCLIASPGNYVFYNTRPIFVWKGQLDKIAITDSNSDRHFWSKEIQDRNNFATYTGKENLQPGKTYELQGFVNGQPMLITEFKILTVIQRQVLSNELQDLEKKLRQEGADKQAIALERANYFIEKQLWPDALQEAYSLENPPAELSEILQNVPERLCRNN